MHRHTSTIYDKSLVQASRPEAEKEECDSCNVHIHYFGHLGSSKGIQLLPEKLEAIKDMPIPKIPKEVRQYLGLCGYNRKIIPTQTYYDSFLTLPRRILHSSGQSSVTMLFKH